MNEAHEVCGSDEWRQIMREQILPWVLGGIDLGDDVLEVGPGYGAVTDVLSTALPRVTCVEIDEKLAAMLTERFAGVPSVQILNADATALNFPDDRFSGAACFTMLHHVPTAELQDRLLAEVARVLRPGATLVASDSIGSDEMEAAHEGDTYNPVDPARLADRLVAAGFADVDVRTNDFGWAATAHVPGC
ncbi:ubiquinone/menaquinone biosynthesis C-methylase UbiE [Mycolicibacterium sp. BK634]|uniref:class I SAM-dependent methyltransferase n=1 Tax=Mycolicibacterium sp. BK634 TaxID=2587099 RepID=UPI00161DE90A|nr:class I SAM-dependent methyltransferase [Mycolicibacterium sp. BK634]MBB3752215.1 ubiquinone/menaquinone biosynthesis C-methylase UbiE [Mycolicibacterium sp. BK634]